MNLFVAFVSALLLVGPAGWGPAVLEADPPPHGCLGDRDHHAHPESSGCAGEWNPHFAHVPAHVVWADGRAGAKTCNGCYACCNGRHDAHFECRCNSWWYPAWGRSGCYQAAQQAQATCRGACLGTWEGNGCTDPEFRIGGGGS